MIVGRPHKVVVDEIATDYDSSSAKGVVVVMSTVVWAEMGCCVVIELADVKWMRGTRIWSEQ